MKKTYPVTKNNGGNTAGHRVSGGRGSVFTLVCLLGTCGVAHLQAQTTVLEGYDFSTLTGGVNNFGPSPDAATTTAAGITGAAITRGSGIGTTGTGASKALGGNGFSTTATTEAAAITANDYFTISLGVATGDTASLSSIDAFNIRRSATGPSTAIFQYAVGSGAYNDIGSAFTIGAITTAAGNPESAISLTGFTALQNLAAGTTVTFRLVEYGATSTGGTFYLNDKGNTTANDFTLSGTVAASGSGPAPTTSLYFDTNGSTAGIGINGGNAAVFDTTTKNFTPTADGTGTPQAFDNTKLAIFGGTAGTVTVGTVTATAGLQFITGGYTLTGGALTLTTNPTIEVTNAGDTATINTQITGTAASGMAGLTKQGAGTLVLGSTANNFTGTVFINSGELSVSNDADLGGANTVSLAGGTLQATASVDVDSTRSLIGTGGLDVASGNTLTIDGAVNSGTITLVNAGSVVFTDAGDALSGLTFKGAGTVDVQGATSKVGTVSFTAPGLLESTTGQTLGATALDATALNGTATVSAALSLTAAGSLNVGASGDLVLASTLTSGGTTSLSKAGAGTLELDGTNTGLYRVQLGSSTTSGGTLVISNANALGANQFFMNAGTLSATADLTGANALPVGVSIGGQATTTATYASVFAGHNVEFTGASDFYEKAGNSNVVTVNNTTIISGVIANGTGGALGTGLTINGTGTFRLSGANTFTDAVTVAGTATLEAAGANGNAALGGVSKVTVNNGGTLLFSQPNQINTAAPIVLNGGAMSIASGVSQGQGATLSGGTVFGNSANGAGALTLAANSTLNFLGAAGAGGTVVFPSFDPTNGGTGSFVLNVTGSGFGTANDSADGTNNRLIFEQDLAMGGLLGDITFNGVADATEVQLDTQDATFYEIIPNTAAVPEPTTVLGGLLMVGAMGWNQRRRWRPLARRVAA